MSSFASSSLKSLRRLVHGRAGQGAPHAGVATVLDGMSAVGATEARVCDVAALGASYPAAIGARVWAGQESGSGLNEFGDVVSSVGSQSSRGALASGIGAAMAGQRATVFISGSDLVGCTDLLMQASGQHLPLVVHLACRGAGGHAQAIGTGHEAYYAASETGCFQMYAANVQEAVDLCIIARRVAEASLVPGIVGMDSRETALAAQDVLLGDEELLRSYLGRSSEMIESPTQAQRMIFGPMRRRVVRMYDLDRPMLVGSLQGTESFGLGAAGGRVYFGDEVREILGKAVDAFAEQTGRRYDGLVTYRTDDAQLVLVVQGSAFETVRGIADWAREHERVKVGVIGVRCLRPFDGAALARALKGCGVAAVMERVDAPLSADGPLMREVRGAMDRARENARFGGGTHGGYPAIGEGDVPRFVGVGYGLGGMELRGADLALLIGELVAPKRSAYYLGLDFVRTTSAYPKQQALMDALRRDFPKLGSMGIRGTEVGPDLSGSAATVVRLCRYAGREHEAMAGEIAGMLHGLLGGSIRSRPAATWRRFDEPCADWLVHGTEVVRDPGDDAGVDIVATALGRIDEQLGLTDRLCDDGLIVLVAGGTDEEIWDALPRDVQGALSGTGRSLYVVSVSEEASQKSWAVSEALLGGVLAAYFKRLGEDVPAEGKIKAAREAAFEEMSEDDCELRLNVLVGAMGSARCVECSGFSVRVGQGVVEARSPGIVRAMGKTSERLGNLPRFWDQVGVFYKAGRTDELLADPCMAVGAVPALSSAFVDVSKTRTVLPEFDAESCEVCPELWMSCPDGSVAPLVISARALIDAGIDLVIRGGGSADALGPIVGKLAKRMNKIAVGEGAPRTAAGLLEMAFAEVVAKVDEDRKVAMGEALAAVVEQVGEMPLVVTDVFFRDAERAKAGSGELFCLVVDPDACKCPELILARGEGRGLRAVEQTPDMVARARRLWELWEKLPDTNGATIERLRVKEGFGPLAAMMLSRHCLRAMSAGDGAEAGSGAKLALRQVLGVAEFHLQPRMQKLIGEIEGLRGRLAERIQKLLGKALPTADLDALAAGLDSLGGDDVELSALSAKVDSALVEGRVDGARLGRLVDAARGLADLQWQLSTGPDGLGRARVGMTIGSGAVAGWSAVFPCNPFMGPAVVDGGSGGGELARGLLEGHLRQVVSGFGFMRWARMELDRPGEAQHAAGELAGLGFADLTDDERALIPPMLVVGDGQTMGGAGLSTLVWLLDSGLPVKVVVLSEIGGSADGAMSVEAMGSYPASERIDIALLALLCRKAFVAQASLGARDHFAASVEGALATAGPALIHIHVPSPERHGFGIERLHEQARLALQSRAFPVLTFDPGRGGVFGSCLDISANPDPMKLFCAAEDGGVLTPADWAATEARFGEHLRPMADGDPAPMPIAGYLELDQAQRAGRTPFVLVGNGEAKEKLVVGAALVADAEARVHLWRTLEELSGQVTPFTQKVRADVEEDVAAVHDAKVASIKQEYEARLGQLRAQFEVEATHSVTNRLMELAGYVATENGGGS